jgi:potassium-transporting ATPase KdpC subunit
MLALLRPAAVLFFVLTLLTGVAYPALVTGVAQLAFPAQATGSLLRAPDGHAVGSTLIGQSFTDPGHFWGRPSATSPNAYNAASSSGSNQGPSNPALAEAVAARIATLRSADPGNLAPIPVDLVTASASGLDPHISPAAAYYQMARVARARHMSEAEIHRLVDAHVEPRTFGLFGEPRVNVLRLNLDLERLSGQPS